MKARLLFVFLLGLVLVPTGWSQWSSDPSKNLPLADNPNGSDQVQPKVRPLPGHGWYVSWFDANPDDPPPVGYDVFYQHLNSTGIQKLKHDGVRVAKLTNSSTEDYGLDFDTSNNALLAFLDTREGSNQQVTAAKVSVGDKELWGNKGVQLTNDESSHAVPKIAGTSDGNVVVAWTSDSNVVLQKLDTNGVPQWGSGIVFSQSGYNYILSDLHASDDGSVIVSWVQNKGFGSDSQLRANKISAAGKLLWGKNNVSIFDTGSLQFGNFPYFIPDGKGGAVFAWYTNSPALQSFAQHILANGKEAFPHNGSLVSTNSSDIQVEPSAAYHAATDEIYVFWTEEDSNQFYNGVSGQKFDSKGNRRWGNSGTQIVPLGNDSQIFVTTVNVGADALVFWVDQVGFGNASIQATRLNRAGSTVCAQFPVSTAVSNKGRLVADHTSAGLAAVAFEDDRTGNNGIYIQNVNPDCSLGRR